jgi:two-component system invasion response regulator UvrY
MTQSPPRILLIDDHPAMRRGVEEILGEAGKTFEFGHAATADDALSSVRGSPWDMAVLDLGLPGAVGFNVVTSLRDEQPKLRILIYTMQPEEQLGVRALQAGADGYLSKGALPDEIVRAVSTVLEGRRYLSSNLASLLFQKVQNQVARQLSEREYQVLQGIATGIGLTEIGTSLSLSVKTISTYRSRILEKLSLESTADLVRYAVAHGIVT